MLLGVRDEMTCVPVEHLASLVSSVTGRVDISHVTGYYLVTLLESVMSEELYINILTSQSLGSLGIGGQPTQSGRPRGAGWYFWIGPIVR